MGLLAWILFLTLDLPFFDDARAYEEKGYSIASDWLSGRSSTWLEIHGDDPYQPLVMIIGIACFYTLTLGVRILPLLIASYALITSYTPVVIYNICKEFGASRRASKISTYIVTLMPIFIIWTGALYKEGLILLCLAFALLHTLKLQKNWSPRSLTLVILNLALLTGLRAYLAVIVAITLMAGTLLNNSRIKKVSTKITNTANQLLIFTAFAVLIVLVGYAVDVREIFPEDFESGMDQIQTARMDLATAESGYLPDVDVTTPWKAIKFMPIGSAYFLMLPKPWDFGSLRQNLAIPDSTIWLVLYPFVFIGMLVGLRKNLPGSFVLILTTIGMLSLYSIFISNIGTAYRLRTQVLMIWAVFAGIGVDFLLLKFERRSVSKSMMVAESTPESGPFRKYRFTHQNSGNTLSMGDRP